MDEFIKSVENFKKRVRAAQAFLRLDDKQKHWRQLQDQMAQPDFWSERKRAERISQEAAALERQILFWTSINERSDDLLSIALADLNDESATLLPELQQEFQALDQEYRAYESQLWLSGPYDAAPAIVTIYSGAGGVDAQDWAQMLERMYLRFAAGQGWATTILQRTIGQEAGIKNVTMKLTGQLAYGYLKTESGVHRLVRISPYDADQSRHTSFAMVEVLPELDEISNIEVSKDDVRVDVYRSSGHGGQSVNTTDSAVRLTHIPTGLTAVCQNERSQMQNKEQAWRHLLGKLARYYQAQQEEERKILRGELTEAAWGNQIRSYVLHPYKLVKDHRTKYEVKDPERVLGGEIMPFIEAALARMSAAEAGDSSFRKK